jgi:peroxiredoxin
MRIKHVVLLLLAVFYLSACNNSGNDFTVVGDINNMPAQQVVLEELGMTEFVLVDSVMSDDKGHFELKGSAPEEGRYRVRFSGSKFILLTIEKGNIKITADWNNIQDYKVAGSPSSESFRVFMNTFRSYVSDINTFNVVKDSMTARGNDSMLALAEGEQKAKIQELTRYIEKYADTTTSPSNALFAVQMLNPETEGDFISAFMGGVTRRFPKSKLVKEYVDKYTEMMEKDKGGEEQVAGPQVGEMAPDVTLTSSDGKQVSISSFKGKYLLVDFWASWCGPCRRENPNVVAAYNKFKDKNFTILGISLDEDRTKWMQAIEKDKLTWTHISDLKGWESIGGRTYGIQSIPANFLIDPQGKIIARDLREDDLQDKLEEVLK